MSNQSVKYRLQADDLGAHVLAVELTVASAAPDGLRLWLPAWIPGSYCIRDYAKHILELTAQDEQGSLRVTKQDKQTWQLAPSSGEVRVRYLVYCHDLSVRGAFINHEYGFINGCSVFLAVDGQTEQAMSITLVPPKQVCCANWTVCTQLTPTDCDEQGFGVYRAQNYNHLIDNPIAMAMLTCGAFEVANTPHRVAIIGSYTVNMAKICADLAKICLQYQQLFGDCPVDSYVFMILVSEQHGGLEHKDCCSLQCLPKELGLVGAGGTTADYINFLSLCSHEYCHLWHVKRLKPSVFIDPDLSKEVYTDTLWIFEGWTSYYQDLMLCRAGLVTETHYLCMLAKLITALLQTPGRFVQTVAQSSFDAWIKLYQRHANSQNHMVSYYLKGAMIAWLMDLHLRGNSDPSSTLDTVLKALWNTTDLQERGIETETVMTYLEQHGHGALVNSLQQWLHTTEELPFDALLQPFGLTVHPSNAVDVMQMQTQRDASLGIKARLTPQGLCVSTVEAQSSAASAGINSGDCIIAIANWRIDDDWMRTVASMTPGETVAIHLFRRGRLMAVDVTLTPSTTVQYQLCVDDDCSDKTKQRREAWLASTV